MIASAPPVQLEELFFPVQEVRANPEYDPNGNLSDTQVDRSINVWALDEAADRYGVTLEIAIDKETSVNPPYFFALHAYATMRADPRLDAATRQSSVRADGQTILLGAARERLLDLTARGPWGRFLLGTTSSADDL
jgi:hypothetical protein